MCDRSRGGVGPSRALLLADLRAEETDKTARANIEARLRELRQRVQPADTVLIFFSGHGAVDKEGNTYLLTRDSRPDDLKESALGRAEVEDLLRSLPVRHTVMFMDACHAAGIMSRGAGTESLMG